MKVIKITKVVSSYIIHYLLFDDDITDESIEYAVEDWCIADPNGSSRGYSYSWVVVDDVDEIRDIVAKKIKYNKEHIMRLIETGEKLSKFYESI